MSYKRTRKNVYKWHLSRLEINEILEKLELSPLHSDNEGDDLILEGENLSTENDNTESRESSESATIMHEELDCEELCKILLNTEKDLMINKMKNDWLHETLVKHFTKKQMKHVCCTDEISNDDIMNKYVNKLYDLDRIKQKTKANYEKWNVELSELHSEISAKGEEEKIAIENFFFVGASIGTPARNNRKAFSVKYAQELISKQLEKIKQISQKRFHNTKLCTELSSIEDSLNDLIALNTDLTKNDYEKLEAEKFYYELELQNKVSKCDQLVVKNNAMKKEINLIRKKILMLKTKILESEKIFHDLRIESQKLLQNKKSLQNQLAITKKSIYIPEFSYHERKTKVISRLAQIRCEHKEWMEKITNILQLIKQRNETINASNMNEFMSKEKNVAFQNIDLSF